MCRASRGISIALRDLRVAKLEKKMRFTPCGQELDYYLNSLANSGGDPNKVPSYVNKAIEECMEENRSRVKPASIAFHLAKFVRR